MEPKPLEGLTGTLCTLLKANVIISIVSVLTGLYDYHTYANIPPGTDFTSTMYASDIISGLTGIAQFVFFIVLGIFFLRWIYRANMNLNALSGEPMTHTPGWSVGYYFIPIINLFKPYQVMKEIWDVSHKYESTDHSILSWWWFLWIMTGIIGQIGGKFMMKADTINEYLFAIAACLVSDGIDIALAIVAISLVTQIGAAYSKNIGIEENTPDGGPAGIQPPVNPNPA